jgi:hypothetical protein
VLRRKLELTLRKMSRERYWWLVYGKSRAFACVCKSSKQRFSTAEQYLSFSSARVPENDANASAKSQRNSSCNDVPLRQTKILASSRTLPVGREPGQTSFRSWSNQLGKEDMFNGLSSSRKRNAGGSTSAFAEEIAYPLCCRLPIVALQLRNSLVCNAEVEQIRKPKVELDSSRRFRVCPFSGSHRRVGEAGKAWWLVLGMEGREAGAAQTDVE